MDYEQYVAARRGRLLEEATARGRTAEEAEEVVDRLLVRHRREIVRADDPHPFLVDALADLLDGRDAGERRTPAVLTWLPLVLLALVVVLVLAAVLLGRGTDDSDDDDTGPRPSRTPTAAAVERPMPLLLGHTAEQAVVGLADLGLRALVLDSPSCAPAQLVLGSVPASGDPVVGDRVTLFVSSGPGGTECAAGQRPAEAEAWRFVRYVAGRGGPPPFAAEMSVVIDGGAPRTITGRAASRLAFDGLAQYFADFRGYDAVSEDGRYPRLSARRAVPPVGRCGVDRPLVFGERTALRVVLESYDLGDDDTCAIAADLYTDAAGRIDGVALYRNLPAAPSGQPDVVD